MSWQPGQPVNLETERFRLRSLTPEDANDAYVSWWNDPEIQQGFNNPSRNWGRRQAEQNIAKFDNRNRFHLGIFCKKTGEMIGFFTIAVDPRNALSSANICIGDKSYHRKGVAMEISRAMIDFRFRNLGVKKIMGKVMGKNQASLNLYKKLGFELEAVAKQSLQGLSGERTDIYYYGLLKEEWETGKSASEIPQTDPGKG